MPHDPNSAMGFDGRRADDHESAGAGGPVEAGGLSEGDGPADASGQASGGGLPNGGSAGGGLASGGPVRSSGWAQDTGPTQASGSVQGSGSAQAAGPTQASGSAYAPGPPTPSGSARAGGPPQASGSAEVGESARGGGSAQVTGSAADVGDDVEHTGETRNQMLQRNVGELLQELRVAQAGVQILFGFLLSVVFTGRFHDASGFEKTLHLLAVLLTVAATALLIAPAAWHRILFRTGRREQILQVGNRVVLVGFGCLAAAITVTVALIAKVSFGPVAMGLVGGMAVLLFGLLWFAVPGMLIGDRRRRNGH
ncbi:DUF6328 family protein [Amycolatopsis echigonensis]